MQADSAKTANATRARQRATPPAAAKQSDPPEGDAQAASRFGHRERRRERRRGNGPEAAPRPEALCIQAARKFKPETHFASLESKSLGTTTLDIRERQTDREREVFAFSVSHRQHST